MLPLEEVRVIAPPLLLLAKAGALRLAVVMLPNAESVIVPALPPDKVLTEPALVSIDPAALISWILPAFKALPLSIFPVVVILFRASIVIELPNAPICPVTIAPP